MGAVGEHRWMMRTRDRVRRRLSSQWRRELMMKVDFGGTWMREG